MGVEGGVRIGGVLFTGVRVQPKEDEQRWARPGNKEKDDPALIERGVALRMSGAARSNIKAAEMVYDELGSGSRPQQTRETFVRRLRVKIGKRLSTDVN